MGRANAHTAGTPVRHSDSLVGAADRDLHNLRDVRPAPLGGQVSLAVDAGAVRGRLAAWAANRHAVDGPTPSVAWQDALLVADQVVARAHATLGAGNAPLWLVDVPLPADAHAVARTAGVAPRALRSTVDALIAAELLDGVHQVGEERVVRVRADVLTDAPVVAAVRWDVVARQLGDTDAPIARLLVRELARRTSIEARAQSHFIAASQRELADAIGYSKASLRRHLDALVAAGLIASRSRDRSDSWHRLQPIVFDEPTGELSGASRAPGLPPTTKLSAEHAARPAALARAAAPGAVPIPSAVPSAAAGQPSASASPAPARPGASAMQALDAALTIEVNGVRVALPPGVELTLEQDATGAIWYRAGGLRLGPVRFT